MVRAHALDAMEQSAIREKELVTYSTRLGCGSFFTASVLYLTLPSPWRVINGDYSSSILRSLLALTAHVVLVLAVLVACRCAKVQGLELLSDLLDRMRPRPSDAKATPPVDRRAALDEVMKSTLRSSNISPPKKATASSSSSKADASTHRSFFDPAPVKTVEDGKAYLRRLQRAADKKKEAEESMQNSTPYGMSGGGSSTYQNDAAFGIYGNLVPRVYQASGFDPYARDLKLKEAEEDALQTSSNAQVAWRQLEDLSLAMFMHLYCRNIRRMLACHVKDFVEAFIQNANELNECGIMADLLLRRQSSQALLCPPGQTNQMTNVTLPDMLAELTKSPLFVSKKRGVFLFEEHRSFEKYLNVGDPNSTDYSSLDRQQYVLERLFLLSKDRNLDRYRWDKGASNWKGKEWADNLPSDAEILMNVFCCMLDNTLPADNERDRPFWKSYFLRKGPRRPFTPSVRSRLYLVQTVGRPPHFKCLLRGAVREIVPGEENCFHAIVVFLHSVKQLKAGYLESINLHRIIDQVFDVST